MTAPKKTPSELVHTFPFFAGVDEATYDALISLGQTRFYDKDEVLFLDGEPCKGLFLVQSGTIKIFKVAENGREQILALQRPGDSVAEVPLFDNGPYPASASALEDSAVLFIPKDAFQRMLLQRPQLAQAIIRALAQRLRKMVTLVEDLSLRQVRQRLARFILAEAAGRASFQLALTNDELAARLGSVRDVISRTLSSLQADGLIRLQGRQVDILDYAKLNEVGA
ncbi:MAG TPA: Crp/Fnr family transcriptional regulator [Armatimonadota bacterium]|nr:Crp/Fnr family transcriptional regulator [Armatimonadota bacterium]